MKGSQIILTANPDGRFDEGTIEGALLPGSFVEVKPSTDPQGGRFTYRAVTRANGAKGPVIILLNMDQAGQLATSAYTSGDRCRVYYPRAGDELNALIRESSGTGTAGEVNVGDKLAIEMATGKLMAGGALASTPFELREHIGVDGGADTLHWVQYTGNQA